MGDCNFTEINPTWRLSNDNRFTQSVTRNKKEESNEDMTTECENAGKWSELPSLPLEKIYSYVKRNDQLNMSLVCHKWNEGFHSPSVWRTFTLQLYDSQFSNVNCPMMKFVQEHSCMFRHVEIEGDFMEEQQLKNAVRHFFEFLQILSRNTQLLTFQLIYSFGLPFIDTQTYNDICKEIIDFLTSQHHLQRLEFHHCYFRYREATQILRILTKNSWQTLTHVVLRDFVKTEPVSEEDKSSLAKSLPKLADFPSLKILDTDYSLIFENMVLPQLIDIQAMKTQNRALSKIILHYDQSGIENYRGLTLTDWRFLLKQYPNLQVEFIFVGFSLSRRELEFFIVPNMPMSSFEFIDESYSPILEISALFDHLLACKTNTHLAILNLVLGETIENVCTTFIPFLQACPKLKCLELTITSSIFNGMDRFLKYFLENSQGCLKKIILDISTEEDPNDFPTQLNIINEYLSPLRMKGLDIKIDLHIQPIIH